MLPNQNRRYRMAKKQREVKVTITSGAELSIALITMFSIINIAFILEMVFDLV